MNGIERIVTPVAPARTDALGGVSAGRAALHADAGVGSGAQMDKQLDGQSSPRLQAGLAQRAPSQDGGAATRETGASLGSGAAAQAVLSADARTVDALLRMPGVAPVIDAARPLCPVSPAAARAALADAPQGQVVAGSQFTALLARALLGTLESSGLFYESHLAQWASGQRERATLDGEPQARLGATAIAPEPPQQVSGSMLDALRAPLAALSALAGLDNTADDGQSAAGGRDAAAAQPVSEALQPLVRQQLELLQTPILRWHGEAWPGTTMAWEIERVDKRDEHTDDGEAGREAVDAARQANWRMQLRLDLPSLGAVDVELQLQDSRLSARLKASPESAATLLHASEALRRRVQAAGIDLKTLSVREFAARGDA